MEHLSSESNSQQEEKFDLKRCNKLSSDAIKLFVKEKISPKESIIVLEKAKFEIELALRIGE